MSATLMKSFQQLTAEDLMSRDLVILDENMSLRAAARILDQNQVSGAPVLDAEGRCVGVFSTADFVRWFDDQGAPKPAPKSRSCSFQRDERESDGSTLVLCTVSEGGCPLQSKQKNREGQERLLCRDPFGLCTDWQVMHVEDIPDDEVRHYMTTDVVTVPPGAPVTVLARHMLDAHIHRLIVVDSRKRPVGIVTSTDLISAIAYGE